MFEEVRKELLGTHNSDMESNSNDMSDFGNNTAAPFAVKAVKESIVLIALMVQAVGLVTEVDAEMMSEQVHRCKKEGINSISLLRVQGAYMHR